MKVHNWLYLFGAVILGMCAVGCFLQQEYLHMLFNCVLAVLWLKDALTDKRKLEQQNENARRVKQKMYGRFYKIGDYIPLLLIALGLFLIVLFDEAWPMVCCLCLATVYGVWEFVRFQDLMQQEEQADEEVSL